MKTLKLKISTCICTSRDVNDDSNIKANAWIKNFSFKTKAKRNESLYLKAYFYCVSRISRST